MEIEPGDNGAGMQPVDENRLDELFRRTGREFLVEGIFDYRMETHAFQKARLQGGRRQAENRGFRPEYGARMRLECQHERGDEPLFRESKRPLQHAAMATVDAIEIADGDDAALQPFGQRLFLFIAVEYGHSSEFQLGPNTQARRGIQYFGAAFSCFSQALRMASSVWPLTVYSATW